MRLLTSCLAIAALFVATTVAQAQLVELGGNLGFEDPFGTGDPVLNLGNWNSFDNAGTGAGTNTIDPRTGLVHGQIDINGVPDSFAGLQQQISAEAGGSYSFSFFAENDPGLDVGIEYRIEYLDATGAEISRDQLTATDFGAEYTQFTVGGIAPVGTTDLRAVIALQSFQGGTQGLARIDDTSILGPAAAVPEPTSLAVLGLGVLGLVTRRRRS